MEAGGWVSQYWYDMAHGHDQKEWNFIELKSNVLFLSLHNMICDDFQTLVLQAVKTQKTKTNTQSLQVGASLGRRPLSVSCFLFCASDPSRLSYLDVLMYFFVRDVECSFSQVQDAWEEVFVVQCTRRKKRWCVIMHQIASDLSTTINFFCLKWLLLYYSILSNHGII